MTRRELEKACERLNTERNELLAMLTTVLRQVGPVTIRRSVHQDADSWTLKGDPTGDGETTVLKAVRVDGVVDTPRVTMN